MENKLIDEAKAFDHQIIDRVAHGHIPDIRQVEPCDYFYNNSWRRPEFVKLDMGEKMELIHQTIHNYYSTQNRRVSILEVGCGPGWLSLELSRMGYDVVGIDISDQCISVANDVAEKDSWRETRGNLKYVCGDFFDNSLLEKQNFDVVVFSGALHHFKEQDKVMLRACELLSDDGLMIANEPTRDRMTEGNAMFIQLIRLLLSVGNGYFQKIEIPQDSSQIENAVQQVLAELKYESDDGHKLQSVNDNEAGHKEMYHALGKHFTEITYNERYAFFHEMIGGLRFDEQTNSVLAKYLKEMDGKLCALGVLQSTEFFFAGKKRKE